MVTIVIVCDCKPARRTWAAECCWASVLQDECEPVRAMAQAALACELKLKGSFETGTYGLLLIEPDGA